MATLANKIIDLLGGTTSVSRKAETPPSTVHSWRSNGIPPSRMAHLRLIAKEEGIAIDWETGERIEHADTDISACSMPETGNGAPISAQPEIRA